MDRAKVEAIVASRIFHQRTGKTEGKFALQPGDHIVPLSSLDLDSLGIVELKLGLEEDFGISKELDIAIDGDDTLSSLTDKIYSYLNPKQGD